MENITELNLDELKLKLEIGGYDLDFLSSARKLEEDGKNRSGAIDLYDDAIAALDESDDEPEEKSVPSYVIAPGKAIPFKAGMKGPGDEVNPEWPEYKANKDLLKEHIAKKLVVQIK